MARPHAGSNGCAKLDDIARALLDDIQCHHFRIMSVRHRVNIERRLSRHHIHAHHDQGLREYKFID